MPLPLKKTDPLQKKLTEINRAAEERDAQRRAKASGTEYIELGKVPISLEAIKLIPAAEARAAQAAAIELKAPAVALAAYKPHDPAVQELIRKLADRHYQVKLYTVSLSSLAQAWYFYKFVPAEVHGITGRVEIEKKHFEEILPKLNNIRAVKEEIKKAAAAQANTTSILEIILAGALANGASDIHLEAEEKNVRIRFRLDGVLQDAFHEMSRRQYETILTRIKLLGKMKINVRGEPQDGRFSINLPAKEIEVRVSIIPSEFGETVVMRILDPDAIRVTLEELGLRPDDFALVQTEIAKPNGLILNTGPTGSGKTTTLYAFLRVLSNPEIKIITIEDPIEYHLGGVEQTQVDAEVGYTFANGLRAILRQDPDAILVGEIRDHETADIAMQASLTGHLVLSTLHTNDAAGAIPRLIDLDIRPATIGPALNLIIAQRLVRKLCPFCRQPVAVSAELRAHLDTFLAGLPRRVNRPNYTSAEIFEPGTCAKCNETGYKGRVGIFEFLMVDAEMESTILKDSSELAVQDLAEKQGMVSMQADGILKAMTGITTFAEVEKVTGPLLWAGHPEPGEGSSSVSRHPEPGEGSKD